MSKHVRLAIGWWLVAIVIVELIVVVAHLGAIAALVLGLAAGCVSQMIAIRMARRA